MESKEVRREVRTDRKWMPELWLGQGVGPWLSLLRRHRFAVAPARLHVALLGTAIAPFHSALGFAQSLLYRRRIAAQSPLSPIFIVGHWRTGTTWLHELLAADPRHQAPSTYACSMPAHFLLTERIGRRLLAPLLPRRRPVDDVSFGWDRPQEDEFALLNLGARSPYETIPFSRSSAVPSASLDSWAPRERERWAATLRDFVGALSVQSDRRVVLKSPTHSFRIPTLLDFFPDARFVQMVRNPFHVIPSTIALWSYLLREHGLQRVERDVIEKRVIDRFVELHEKVLVDEARIPAGRFARVRYEDLVANPKDTLERLYSAAELGSFEDAREPLEREISRGRNHQSNRYTVGSELTAEIESRCARWIEAYGYEKR